MIAIKIDDKEVQKGLLKVAGFIGDMSKAFKAIADLELSQTKLRYKNEQDPKGKPWPDPITIRRDGTGSRNTKYTKDQLWGYVLKSNYHAAPPGYHFFSRSRGDKVLRDSGQLMLSIGRAYGKGFALVGTNKTYAKKLQSGRFPFLGINKKTYDNIEKTFTQFFRKIGNK